MKRTIAALFVVLVPTFATAQTADSTSLGGLGFTPSIFDVHAGGGNPTPPAPALGRWVQVASRNGVGPACTANPCTVGAICSFRDGITTQVLGYVCVAV